MFYILNLVLVVIRCLESLGYTSRQRNDYWQLDFEFLGVFLSSVCTKARLCVFPVWNKILILLVYSEFDYIVAIFQLDMIRKMHRDISLTREN